MADVAIQVSEEEPSVGDSSLFRCLAKITEKGLGTNERAKSATQFRVIENKRRSDETRFKEATAVRVHSQKGLQEITFASFKKQDTVKLATEELRNVIRRK